MLGIMKVGLLQADYIPFIMNYSLFPGDHRHECPFLQVSTRSAISEATVGYKEHSVYQGRNGYYWIEKHGRIVYSAKTHYSQDSYTQTNNPSRNQLIGMWDSLFDMDWTAIGKDKKTYVQATWRISCPYCYRGFWHEFVIELSTRNILGRTS